MYRVPAILCFICLPFLSGCETEPPSREELGRIVFSPSEVPGADKPYTLPDYLREDDSQSDPSRRAPGD